MLYSLVPIARRQDIFFEAFTAKKVTALNGSQTPFSIFVKKLQESLTRMESFEVVTVAQNIDGIPIFNAAGFHSLTFDFQNLSGVPHPCSLDNFACG